LILQKASCIVAGGFLRSVIGYTKRQFKRFFLSANAEQSKHDRLNVGEIARQFRISRPAISHHLKVLKDASIV
jgi:DNA-binding transcriptional ArsR family regulator